MKAGAAQVKNIVKVNGDSIEVANNTTIYTESFGLPRNAIFAVVAKLAGSSPDIDVDLEYSNDEPTTEKSADAAWATIESERPILEGITDTNTHIGRITPAPTKFARLKITGNAGNGADTSFAKLEISYILNI